MQVARNDEREQREQLTVPRSPFSVHKHINPWCSLMADNFLIIGDDIFLRDKETARIRDKFLDPAEADLNYSAHTPDDSEGIMGSLGTMPFLADKRVVLVKDSQDMPEGLSKTIVSYLEEPCETGVLVLCADSSYGKTSSYRKLSKLMKVVRVDAPDEGTIKHWIRSFFRKEGVEITSKAVDLIVELKGTDTTDVKLEIDKILAFSSGENIDAPIVESLVGRSVTESIFKLVDAINARDSKWTFRVLNDLYDQKKSPQEIIGTIGWHMRMIQNMTVLLPKRMSDDAMASEMKCKPWQVKKLRTQIKKYPPERVERWVALLLDTDRKLKTGKVEATLAVEMLLVTFLNT